MTHAAGNSLMIRNVFTSGLVQFPTEQPGEALIRQEHKGPFSRPFPFPVEAEGPHPPSARNRARRLHREAVCWEQQSVALLVPA